MAVKSLGVDIVMKYLDYDKLMELKRELNKNTYRYLIVTTQDQILAESLCAMKTMIAFSPRDILEKLALDSRIVASLAFEKYWTEDICWLPDHNIPCGDFVIMRLSEN